MSNGSSATLVVYSIGVNVGLISGWWLTPIGTKGRLLHMLVVNAILLAIPFILL